MSYGEVLTDLRADEEIFYTPYQFNGYERDEETGFDYAHQRYYWSDLGVFLSIDPLAAKYPGLSPYAYCANNPVIFVDPDGREISFSYKYEEGQNGQSKLSGITMNVTGKVINVSSGEVDMKSALQKISSQIESSFQGEVNGVSFNTNVNLSIANSMDEVSDNDHVFALADISKLGDNTVAGASNQLYGKVAFIEADYFRGVWDKSIGNTGKGTAAHEFGHLLGLEHPNKGFNLMMSGNGNNWFSYSTKLNNNQLESIHNNRNSLNQGSNRETMFIFSPSAGSNIQKSMPNRGQAKSLIKY